MSWTAAAGTLSGTYRIIEQPPSMTTAEHDRLRPGLNHLAGPREQVDKLTTEARRRRLKE